MSAESGDVVLGAQSWSHPTASHPNPSDCKTSQPNSTPHPISLNPIPNRSNPLHPIPRHCIPLHSIPSHHIPTQSMLFFCTPSQPNPSHPIASYPNPIHLIALCPIPSHPNTSHRISSHPIPFQPNPLHPILSQPNPIHLISTASHPIPTQPISSQPIPSTPPQPIPSHFVPSHPIPSHPCCLQHNPHAHPHSALTELPAPHVVELGAQQQCGHDVHDREDDPEDHVAFAKDLRGEPSDQQVGKWPPHTMPSPAAHPHSPHQ